MSLKLLVCWAGGDVNYLDPPVCPPPGSVKKPTQTN